jgi:hypothetical protein
MQTIKIKSTHPETQGPFVVIDAADFDPAKHTAYTEPKPKKDEAKK